VLYGFKIIGSPVAGNKSLFIFAPAFRAKRLVEGLEKEIVSGRGERERRRREAGKNYLCTIWKVV
jgi:hypothetical protein